MRGVDHDPLGIAAPVRQRCENLVEHPQAAPTNKPIVDRLVRTILRRGVAPTKPILDHKHNRAHDPTVIHPRDAMRQRKIPHNPTHLSLRQQEQISHGEASQPPPMNQPIRPQARTLIGPEPRSQISGTSLPKYYISRLMVAGNAPLSLNGYGLILRNETRIVVS